MSFRKAKGEQAALKMCWYGKAGSGKTFSSLLVAEGLAKLDGKRVAVVDTEHGTDFYCQAVKERNVHPDAFDFDALYTRSIMDVVREVKALDVKTYSVVVIDSMTHLWNVCIDSYEGKKTSAGTIPMHAWGKIKAPYKELMDWMMGTTQHVIICGRQGNEYGEDPDKNGELKMVGYKIKAEGETGYEPHMLIRLEPLRRQHGEPIVVGYVEKDRSGMLQGKAIQWPNFDNIAKPLLSLLGDKQAAVDTDAAARDAASIDDADADKQKESQALLDDFLGQFLLCKSKLDVEKVSKSINAKTKKRMTAKHVTELRERYRERVDQVPAEDAPEDRERRGNTTEDAQRELLSRGRPDAAAE